MTVTHDDASGDTWLSDEAERADARWLANPLDQLSRELARLRASSELFGAPTPAVAIGRYLVVERIGSGGMGVVYAAYDPELDRKIALKLLNADTAGVRRDDPSRLLREARALARLTHPNVVAVYDVGTIAGGPADGGSNGAIFIAMEYVDGVTLTKWLTTAPRTAAEIVKVMIEAGRGLAAAHAGGLVHRDFKPDNVMIDATGRVLVMDFGLARAAAGGSSAAPSWEGESTTPTAVASLSQTGRAVGTPAYMAPEQFRGEEVGAACDQFGFCVTVWEALHGQRPFRGETPAALWTALEEARPLPTASPRGISKWLRSAIARGLSFSATDRWPTMDALLHTLERGRTRARRHRMIAAAACVTAIAAGVFGLHALERRDAIAACERAGADVEAWWPAREEEVRAALLDTGSPAAERTAERVQSWLDTWADAWKHTRAEACVRHDVEQTLSTEHYRRAQGCLDVQVAGVAATIDELAAGSRASVHRAAKASTRVVDPRDCLDALRLERGSWPDEAEWDATLELRRRMAALSARGTEETQGDVVAEARAIVDDAVELDWTPLVAEARIRLAGVLSDMAKYDDAAAELHEAYHAAGRVGADDLSVHAAAQLAYVLAVRLARPDDGLEWVRHGEMVLERLGGGEPAAAAMLLLVRADVHRQRAEYDDAFVKFREVLELRRRELPPDHPDVAETLNVMASVEFHRGRPDQARALYEEALGMTERALGPEHPDLAHILNNLANVHAEHGAHGDAEPLYERALAIRERALGSEHPSVAASLGNLAALHFTRRHFDRALPLYQRAVAIKQAALGDTHPDLVISLVGVCNTQRGLGALDDALAACERALAIAEQASDHRILVSALRGLSSIQAERGESEDALQTSMRALASLENRLGPDHPDVATVLHLVAGQHVDRGEETEALALRERALTIRERAFGPDDPQVAASLEWVAESHRALGSPEQAEQLYERALAIRERVAGPKDRGVADALTELGLIAIALHRPGDGITRLERALAILHEIDAPAADRGYTELALARVLPAAHRERALDLARTAAASYRAAGDTASLAEAEAWLAATARGR